MAVGTITRFSEGMGADQYDAVTEKWAWRTSRQRG